MACILCSNTVQNKKVFNERVVTVVFIRQQNFRMSVPPHTT